LVEGVTSLGTRASTLVEIAEQGHFYFEPPAVYDPEAAGKLLTAEVGPRLDRLQRRLADLAPWDEATLEGACRQLAQELGVKLVDLAQPVRLALTGRTASPPVFGIMAALGREETARRLRALRVRVP
jgi:glutamyl-tRNA synthetase